MYLKDTQDLFYPGMTRHNMEMIALKKEVYSTYRSVETGSMPHKGASLGSTMFGQ